MVDETSEGLQEELAFRVKALVRWGYCLSLPLLSAQYRTESASEMQVTVKEEWAYTANVLGHLVQSLARSLPADDVMRRLHTGIELGPEIAMDLLYPTQEDYTLDTDFAATTSEPIPGAIDLIIAGSQDRDGSHTTDILYRLSGGAEQGQDRNPDPDQFAQRISALDAAADAIRWLMWRRRAYLMGDDPHGIRNFLIYPVTIDRAFSGKESTPGVYTDVIERHAADLAIARAF